MKNIVVVGGITPKKFGHEFVTRARSQGHRVKVLTWRPPNQSLPDTDWGDFHDLQHVVSQFNSLVQDLDHIDILLYNANGESYPYNSSFFTSTCQPLDVKAYHNGLDVQVVVPHALSLAALAKMDHTSSLVFMTTGMALDHKRTGWTHLSGYAGSKSWQTHLMLAFAHNNDKQAISVAISPFFDYQNPERCTATIDRAVNLITNLNSEHNGQILHL